MTAIYYVDDSHRFKFQAISLMPVQFIPSTVAGHNTQVNDKC